MEAIAAWGHAAYRAGDCRPVALNRRYCLVRKFALIRIIRG